MTNFNEEIKIKTIIFINGERGYELIKFLKDKIKFNKIYLSKKFLNIKSLNKIIKFKIPYQIIDSIKKKIIIKSLNKVDLAIVCGFPYIFPNEFLKIPKYGIINCHAGRLPEYRGGSPLNWQIINQEKYIGISVIKMSSKIDEGKIINKTKFLNNNYNITKVHKKVNSIFPNLVFTSIKDLKNNKKLKNQNKNNAKYWRQRTSEDSLILPKKLKISKILAMIKALQDPYPKVYFLDKNNSVNIEKAIKYKKKIKPGYIKYNKKSIILGCKDHGLKIIKFKVKKNEK